MDSIDEFNPEARDAQSAELERIRRLELQCSSRGGENTPGDSPPSQAGPAEGGTAQIHTSAPPQRGSSSPEVVHVEKGAGPSSSRAASVQRQEPSVEAIIIESGSSDSDNNSQRKLSTTQHPVLPARAGQPSVTRPPPSGRPVGQTAGQTSGQPPQRRLLGKYEVYIPRTDGRVLVNIGHRMGEQDVFMAPQIAKAAKVHQVCET